jgi:hypothetical protein
MLRAVQNAKKQEEAEAKEAGLEGKDAFEELKKLSLHRNDPLEDLERLYRDAAEGLVVAGREPTWEATRPTVLPAGTPLKHRGFIDYRRCARTLSFMAPPSRLWGSRVHNVFRIEVTPHDAVYTSLDLRRCSCCP